MNKNILYLILLVFVSSTFLNYSFAECNIDNPPQTCYNTSNILEEYLDTMYYLLTEVKVSNYEDLYDSNPSNILDQSREEAYNEAKKVFDLGKAVAFTARTLTPRYGTDLVANTKILFNSKVAIRDRKLITGLDDKIGEKLKQVIYNEVYFRTISEKRVNNINTVLKDIEFQDFKLNGSITYGDYLLLLRGINSVYKNLYFEAINNSKNSQDARTGLVKLSNDLKSQVSMQLDETQFRGYKSLLTSDYGCSTGSSDVCPGSIAKFQKSLKHILSYAASSGVDSMDRFQENLVRLKQALQHVTGGETGSEFKERRDKLLYEYYGWESNEILECDEDAKCMWGVGMARNNLKESIINPGVGLMDKSQYEIKNLFEKNDANAPESKPKPEDVEITKAIEAQQMEFRNVLNTISENHNLKSTNITLEDPTSRTRIIPGISRQVYDNILLIGSKQGRNGIIWNMGEACKNQCTNIEGICRY